MDTEDMDFKVVIMCLFLQVLCAKNAFGETEIYVERGGDVCILFPQQGHSSHSIIRNEKVVCYQFNPGSVIKLPTVWNRPFECFTNSSQLAICIDNVQDSDAGIFNIRIGSIISENKTLSVIYAPNITDLPDKQYTVEGSSLSIKCKVTPGNPAQYTVRWTRMDDPLFIQNGATLHIINIQRSDGGIYTCKAENIYPTGGNGTSRQNMVIDVLYPPRIEELLNVRPIEGSDLSVTCDIISGNPSSTIFKWTASFDNNFSQNGAVLHLANIHRSRSGTYKCTAENNYPIGGKGMANKTLFIDVLYPPQIENGVSVTANENMTVSLSRMVNSNPPVTAVFWYRHGTVLNSVTSSQKTTYTIQRAQCIDMGNYTIVAKNNINPDDVSQVQLFVNCKPRTESTDGENITLGVTDSSGIYFKETFTAYPLPSAILLYSNNTVVTTISLFVLENSPNNFTITFHKLDVKQEDYTNYKLKVKNDHGEDVIYINVLPERKPSPPIMISAICVDSTSADIKWISSHNGGSTQHFRVTVLTSDSQIYRDIDKIEDSGKGNLHSKTVTSLQPCTLYVFNMSATNVHGTAYASEAYTCTSQGSCTRCSETDYMNMAIAFGSLFIICLSVTVLLVVFIVYMKRKQKDKTERKERNIYNELQEVKQDNKYEEIEKPAEAENKQSPALDTDNYTDLKQIGDDHLYETSVQSTEETAIRIQPTKDIYINTSLKV